MAPILLCTPAMVRITTRPGAPDGPTTLVVEGRLAGAAVEALRGEAAAHPGRLRLDLTGLSYADAAGVALLTSLLAGRASLGASNAYAATLLGRA